MSSSVASRVGPGSGGQRGWSGKLMKLAALEAFLLLLLVWLVLSMTVSGRPFVPDPTRPSVPIETPTPVPAPLGS
jgi:hypothetical protein